MFLSLKKETVMPQLLTHDPQAWLDTDETRRLSDIVLGVITLLIGALILWIVPDNDDATFRVEHPGYIGSWDFPVAVAGLLCVIAFVLLIRAALRRSPPAQSYTVIHLVTAIVLIAATGFASWTLLQRFYLRFGPPEFMAFKVFLLALAIALAHSSRTRAVGMMLLGLLLATIGMNTNTGLLRFTMNIEVFAAGINKAVLLFGLFVVSDAIVCLTSVTLFLRTYTQLIKGGRIDHIPQYASLVIRVAAVIVLVSTPFFAYGLSGSYIDIVLIFAFGAFGVAAKIFGWNRFLLYAGFAYGAMLEDEIRQAFLTIRGDLVGFFGNLVSGSLVILTLLIIACATVLSVRRAKIQRL